MSTENGAESEVDEGELIKKKYERKEATALENARKIEKNLKRDHGNVYEPYIPQSQAVRLSEEEASRVMAELSSMTITELRKALSNIGITSLKNEGSKKVLRKRVATEYGRRINNQQRKQKFFTNKTARLFDYLVVMDFECTCIEIIYDYPHEIIEFPAVLIDLKELKKVDEFRTYIRPRLNPILDPFCINFTGITQETVDAAPPFHEALLNFYDWMDNAGLFDKNVRFAFVTDGPHDIWKFLQFQCNLDGMKLPHIFRSYINLKRIFETKVAPLQKGQGQSGIQKMLNHFDLTFEGSAHSGLDDATNIARIAIEMIKKGIELRINERCAKKNSAEERELSKKPPNEAQKMSDMHIWRKKLPLRYIHVTRKEFLDEDFADCSTCDDEEDEIEQFLKSVREERQRKQEAELRSASTDETSEDLLTNTDTATVSTVWKEEDEFFSAEESTFSDTSDVTTPHFVTSECSPGRREIVSGLTQSELPVQTASRAFQTARPPVPVRVADNHPPILVFGLAFRLFHCSFALFKVSF
ncbi:unnamed protein product [Caenorhabditis auriculariae]|uniref:Exonuclease domain-containing protein n=1 Tax=Caenorhabditis auriculariae TaxID=2777116 RepID=A0A8S1HJP7_9PELO|nr:unnamed protein product [Caenorhabditis auriculariae]